MSAEGAITVSGLTSLDTHTRVRWTRVCDHRYSKPEFSDCSACTVESVWVGFNGTNI